MVTIRKAIMMVVVILVVVIVLHGRGGATVATTAMVGLALLERGLEEHFKAL